jgi:hypothetical protein
MVQLHCVQLYQTKSLYVVRNATIQALRQSIAAVENRYSEPHFIVSVALQIAPVIRLCRVPNEIVMQLASRVAEERIET